MTLPASSLFVARGRLTTTLQLVRRSTNRCNVNIFGCSASSSICDNPPSLTSRQRYTPGSDSVCSRPFNRRRNSRASSAVEAVARPTLRGKACGDDAREFLRGLNGREQTASGPGEYSWGGVNQCALSPIDVEV